MPFAATPKFRPFFAPHQRVVLDRGDYLSHNVLSLWVPQGDKMRDLGPYGHHGAFQTSHAFLQPTEYGQGMECLPVNQSSLANVGYAKITNSADYDNTSGTMGVWFEIDEFLTSTQAVLISRAAFSNNQGATIYCNGDNTWRAVAAVVRDGTTSTDLISASVPLVAGNRRLQHAMLVWRSGGRSELYHNGLLLAANNSTVSFNFASQDIYLGAHSQVGSGFFTGLVGRILRAEWHNRALNPNEVQRLFLEGPTALLKPSSRRLFFVDPATQFDASAGITAGIALGTASDGGFDREPFVSQGLGLGQSFTLDEQYGVESQGIGLGASFQTDGELEKEVSQGLGLGSTLSIDPSIAGGFSLGATTTFTLEDSFGSFSAGFGLGSKQSSDSGELANRRYRR